MGHSGAHQGAADLEAWLGAHIRASQRGRDGLRSLRGRRRRRGRIAVVTDSACSLPAGLLGPLADGLQIVPIPVMIGEQIYPEDPDRADGELDRDLQLAMAQGTAVRTSRPSPGRLADVYRQLQAEGWSGIVSVHLSSLLSGTVDAARLAAEEVDVPVDVVDSLQAGLSMGHAVLDAAVAARFGADLELVAQTAAQTAQSSASLFVVPSLEQLRRGGRITTLAGVLGTLLGVKPLLQLTDGEVGLLERPHTLARAMDRLTEHVRGQAEEMRRPRIAVHCCGNVEQGRELADTLAQRSDLAVPQVELPPALAAHLGLGALAVCISPTLA